MTSSVPSPAAPTRRRALALAATALLAPAALTACGGSSSSSSPAPGPGTTTTKVGVGVTGGYGQKPALTVPNTPAPATLSAEVLKQGDGPAVASGQSVIVNYLGQTWAPKDGKPNVFDNSYDRQQPAAFLLGAQGLIAGWNKTLVGQKAGSRLLLTIPPADGYGTAKDPNQPLAGETLLFVVDLLGSIDKGVTAKGTAAGPLPAGYPQVTSASGAVPVVTGVQGVDPNPKAPKSALLIRGSGAPIDPSKNLLLQLLQVDAKTGKPTQSTFEVGGPQVAGASAVVNVVSALKGATLGSRAVAVVPASGQQQSAVLVVDVIGQY